MHFVGSSHNVYSFVSREDPGGNNLTHRGWGFPSLSRTEPSLRNFHEHLVRIIILIDITIYWMIHVQRLIEAVCSISITMMVVFSWLLGLRSMLHERLLAWSFKGMLLGNLGMRDIDKAFRLLLSWLPCLVF